MPVTEDELKTHQKNIGGKRVTLDALKENIEKVDFIVHAGTQLTLCVITLKNGFTVTGESACADPAMFNKEIGERIAQENAEKKIWPLMGYALKQELFLATGDASGDFRDRVRAELKETEDRLAKLEAFVHGAEQFDRLSMKEQSDLREQLVVMQEYRGILARRVNRF